VAGTTLIAPRARQPGWPHPARPHPAAHTQREGEGEGLPATLTLDPEAPSGAAGISHPRITPGSR